MSVHVLLVVSLVVDVFDKELKGNVVVGLIFGSYEH